MFACNGFKMIDSFSIDGRRILTANFLPQNLEGREKIIGHF
jgi:hypothetical protein